MASERLDNPAGRLHALLSRLRGIENPHAVPVQQAWSRILDLSAPDLTGYAQAMSQVLLLPGDAAARVESLGDLDNELYLRWRPSVDAALSRTIANGSAPLQEILGLYDNATLSDLEFCSYELSRRMPESRISTERVAELREQIAVLLGEIADDEELDPALKAFLAEHIEDLLEAVDAFRIRGLRGLEQAFDRTVGALVRHPKMAVHVGEDKPTLNKVKAVLASVAAALTVANTTLSLPHTVYDSLHPGDQPSVVLELKELPGPPTSDAMTPSPPIPTCTVQDSSTEP